MDDIEMEEEMPWDCLEERLFRDFNRAEQRRVRNGEPGDPPIVVCDWCGSEDPCGC